MRDFDVRAPPPLFFLTLPFIIQPVDIHSRAFQEVIGLDMV